MRSLVLALCTVLALGACSAKSVWAPDDAVAKAVYQHNGPPKLTLLTSFKNETGQGAHTSLMINGSQRVIFNPSGSYNHELTPERHDVLFGITPQMVDLYTDYHTHEDFKAHVLVQEIIVSPEVAEMALRAVMANGTAPYAQCSLSTSSILSGLPGFGTIKKTWLPKKLSQQFGAISGVTTRTIH